MFKKLRGVRFDYFTQGYIYFMCAIYDSARSRITLPEDLKADIRAACNVAANGNPGHASAIFALMVERRSVQSVSREFYMSPETLYRLRRRFYDEMVRRMRET